MNFDDFDKRFEKNSKEFDRDFKRIKIFNLIFGAIALIGSVSLTIFGVWIVIMLMRFFGVL